ncbi:MAG TPA: RNA 2',3'-cyclic phosphodiesterase [Amycolatopsis sp.]|nr:RNA 2',3'-cyclic phosphodiesterase [Amycolatopsis sp.]
MQLFSAIVPPADVVASLDGELARLRAAVPGPRWIAPEQWHVTLGFYGQGGDPDERADRLRGALAGQAAPTLRLAGAGTFSRVLYVGVYSDGLAELAVAAGAGRDRPYLPHLTVARTRGEVPAELPHRLGGYSSGTWTAAEAVLMRSDPGEGGSRYTVTARFPLVSRRAGAPPA